MAGAGYKLFNTGDVLTAAQVNTYLMEQSVMVFANAAARTTALSGVLAEGMLSYLKDTDAVEVYNGSAWVASDDPNAIQNSIVDAKGDLISASAADVPARLAVGNNGETLVADSSATTGLRWQADWNTGKNKIINGDFGIWQRGTSFSSPASLAYLADRFQIAFDGSGATRTISRQTLPAGDIAGYEYPYFFRFNQSVAGTGGTFNGINQRIEGVETLAGQTVTLSFWAKADATRTVLPNLQQNFGSGGSATVNITSGFSTINLTTSWTRYSVTVSVPSISGKTIGTSSYLQLFFGFASNTVQTVDLFGVQLEAGSVATPFTTATGTLAGELAACQRYYQRQSAQSAYTIFGSLGAATSTIAVFIPFANSTTFRVTPTAVDYSTLIVSPDAVITSITPSAVVITTSSSPSVVILNAQVTGATQFRPYYLYANNSSSAYIGLSAEL